MSRRYAYLRALARRFGYHLVKADHYSPIPDLDVIPEDWRTEQAAAMPGVDLRLDDSLEYLRTLAPYAEEYAPPDHPPGTASGYFRENAMYNQLDAEVLYGIVRDLKPSRIVDVGAGFSTLVIEDALIRNRAEGSPCDHQIFDPYPAPILAGKVEVAPMGAEQIPEETFTRLGPGDILFIDTTHTVRPGGDVVRLILEVVPALAPGVVVHIHDFFRPFEYPRFLYDLGYYWQEHHLVQALLTDGGFEVIIANHAVSRLRPDELRAVLPTIEPPAGSALWIRRTA